MIDKVLASKSVGWDRQVTIEMPSEDQAKQLLIGVLNEEQDSYEEVLRIHRYATSEQYATEAGRIIGLAYSISNNPNYKHIHV